MSYIRSQWLATAVFFCVYLSLLLVVPAPFSSLLLAIPIAGSVLTVLYRHRQVFQRLFSQPAQSLSDLAASFFFRSPGKWMGLVSLCAALLAAYFLDFAAKRSIVMALPVVIIGAVAMGFALHGWRVPAWPPPRIGAVSWRPACLVGGLLALAALAEINGNWLSIPAFQRVSYHIQFMLLCAGIALVVRGLAGTSTPTLPYPQRGSQRQTYSLFLITAVTLLAFVLRAAYLDDTIRRLVDELNFINVILRFADDYSVPLLRRSDPWMAFPHLFVYGQYLGVGLFGHTLAGIRMVSAVLGTLTVPAVYLLGRELFDRRTGTLAAVLLATFPPHLQFSRVGLNNVADPLFGTLALAFLACGIRTGRQRHYVLAGAALGLTQYFYEGGQLLFPALAGLWLGSLWLTRRLSRREIALFAVTALIAAAPVHYAALASGARLAPRLNTVTNATLPDFTRILDTFLVYVHKPETPLFIYYYGGQTALILPVLVPLFLLGAFYTLRFMWRSPGLLLVALWIALTSAGNSLLVVSELYARYVVVFPALALLLAVGLNYSLPITTRLFPARLRRKRFGVALVLLLAGWQAIYYFGPHLKAYDKQMQQLFPVGDIDDALLRSTGFPSRTQLHFIGRVPPDTLTLQATLRFLRPDLSVDSLARQEVTDAYLVNLPDRVDHAFYLEFDDDVSLAVLEAYFDLQAPVYSQYVAVEDQYTLYYGRRKPHN